jgi:hypothetical protein
LLKKIVFHGRPFLRRHAAYCIATLAALTAITPSLRAQCFETPQPLTITVAVVPSPSVFGQDLVVNVTTSGQCGVAPGSVQLTVDGLALGYPIQLNSSGAAAITIPDLNDLIPGPGVYFLVGSHTVGVAYGEQDQEVITYQAQAASQNQITTIVNKASTTTTLSAATNGTSLTAQVSVVSPGAGTPTGTVTFSNRGTSIGSASVSNGQATLSTSGLVGLFTATYSGDSSFAGSASSALQVGVLPPPPTSALTLTSTFNGTPLNTSTIGQAVTFTASLTVMNGNGPPGGTIQFSDGANLLGSPVPVLLAQATYTTATLAVGNHNINATYSGDSQYPSTGASRGFVVDPVASVLTLTSSLSGQAATLTVQIGPSPPTGVSGPTGQVTFSDGTTQLGVVPVASAGATLQVPLASGTHQIVAVYSGDADWARAQASIAVTVNVVTSPLTIVTISPLPEATVGVAYTAPTAPPMAASGGLPPYQWSLVETTTAPSASGIFLASNGTFSGAPTTAGNFTLNVRVTDSESPPVTVNKQFMLQVAAAPLTITTPLTVSTGTIGSTYSQTVTASGGIPPYTFSVLPSSFTIQPTSDPATATISGTPTVTGTVPITVTVTDSAKTTKSATFNVVFALPAVPPVTIGIVGNIGPTTQPALEVNLGAGFPVAITGTLTLTFQAAQGGGDNPEVQFSTGGRTVPFTIPANSTAPIPTPQLQTGTVAGTITITADLKAAGTDVTPAPVPTQQIVVSAAPPTISATATTTATGFTVTVTGFSTTLDMSQAVFQFNAASGANLQTTSLTVPLGPLFSSFYQTNPPAMTGKGSQFVYVQPFTVNGSGAITSVTVTMANTAGTSQAATATIQ